MLKLLLLLLFCTLCVVKPSFTYNTVSGQKIHYENSSSTFICKKSHATWIKDRRDICECTCPGKCGDVRFDKTRITAYCNGSRPVLHFKQMKIADNNMELACSGVDYIRVFVGRMSPNFYYKETLALGNNIYTLVCKRKMGQMIVLYNDATALGVVFSNNAIKNLYALGITSDGSKVTLLMKKVSLKDKGQIFGCSLPNENRLYLLTLSDNDTTLLITKLNASQESRNRYVFTCYTKNSLQDLTYEWYWNNFQVSTGLSSSMVDGKSQGSIVFDMLNEADSGNVTCHVRRRHYIPTTRRMFIHIMDFPKVKLYTTSEIIHNQNPVNVSCFIQPPYQPASRVFKVNDELVTTSMVSLTKEANVSCYAANDNIRGEIKTLKISMAIGKKLCPHETFNNLQWPETVAESTANVTCIGEFSGTASRLCLTNGTWELPNIECVKKSIVDARSSLGRIEIGIGWNFQASVESLANATKELLNAEDIGETVKALDSATRITKKSAEVNNKDIKNLVHVMSNLVAKDTKAAWVKLEKKSKITAVRVMKQMGDFGKVASEKLNKTMTISTENLVIELAKVNAFDNITFPNAEANHSKWVQESDSNVFVPSAALKDNFGVNETVIVNAVLFRYMKELLPNYEKTNSSINSFVLSISLQKTMKDLTHKILLNFSHVSSEYSNASCNFWDFNINPARGGYWSTRGCEVVDSNVNYTVCSCDHLTNFAILMNPVSHKSRKILNIITIVGCSISIIALVVTIIVYVIFWKHVTSTDVSKSQSILLMNMCVSLIVAYVIFVAFVEGPRDKGVCTAIAALIQYFYLVVFFTMFAEGIDMAIAFTFLFSFRFHRLPWLLLLSWVAPAVIVAISLASTMTKGFGNGKFCWLTSEDNAIWSFIVPALIIILANIVCVIFIVKALLSTRRMLRENVKERLRTGARAIGILTPLLGFTWLFGVFAVNEDLVVFEYIFTISSSLQGLFIFIAYCVFNKQIRNNICKKEKFGKQVPIKPTQSTSKSNNTKETDLTSFADKSDMGKPPGIADEKVAATASMELTVK